MITTALIDATTEAGQIKAMIIMLLAFVLYAAPYVMKMFSDAGASGQGSHGGGAGGGGGGSMGGRSGGGSGGGSSHGGNGSGGTRGGDDDEECPEQQSLNKLHKGLTKELETLEQEYQKCKESGDVAATIMCGKKIKDLHKQIAHVENKLKEMEDAA